ncbi:efflux RND transporter periplasmic adaptor subunit [Desulfoluna sp.]|uniref:efflux RND transporter periplasmic adaptor subunit n=1 Tax=Desulfoluna sp. TaxID=2045199 RepID=UPI00261A48C0|nr:efflux RND transporter periplasmic adaptor subunit [Desulfoluna sp.]
MTPKLSPPCPEKSVIRICLSWWPVLVLFLILVLLYLMSVLKTEAVAKARRSQRKEGPPPINVVTLTLAPALIKERITLPGEIRANRQLAVPSEVSAVFLKKTRHEGHFIQQGETLAQLDTSRYSARLQAEKALFIAAQASSRRLKNLNLTQLATPSDLDHAAANLEQARNALTAARLDLSKCEIKAPFSGYLDAYLVEKGDFVTPGTLLCRLVELDPVKIRVGIPESKVTKVRTAAAFSVFVDALGDSPLPGGRVFHLARATDNKARLYNLDLLFPNKKGRMAPGMFARVELVTQIQSQALIVPLYAIIARKNGPIVFIEEGGKAVMREVQTGIQEGWRVEVTQGLTAGDHVIVVGQRSVSEGRKMTVVRHTETPGELHP